MRPVTLNRKDADQDEHGDRDDVYTRSRAELTALIQIAMGGQVAEEIFFGDVSTGPAGDEAGDVDGWGAASRAVLTAA